MTARIFSPNAQRIVDRAFAAARAAGLEVPGAAHWMDAVLAESAALASRLCPSADVTTLRSTVDAQIKKGEFGTPTPVDELLSGLTPGEDDEHVAAKWVVAGVLRLNGLEVPLDPDSPAAEPKAQPAAPAPAPKEKAPVVTAPEPAYAKRLPTPTLDSLGCDLTAMAAKGALAPIFGREDQVDTLVEVLCRTQKRNPLLIGAPGSGKTAIVEDFARRVSEGRIPEFLRDVRVISIDTSTLTSGTGVVGTFEERVQKVIAEASQPGIVLFLDEAHTMIDAGGRGGGLADTLKPALARGDLALIAATTDDEYRRLIKPDGALERRFQPIPVPEMDADATLEVLRLRSRHLAGQRGVTVPESILSDLVTFADVNMRNRTFPDKAIDLLEQCVAHAVATGQTTVTAHDAGEVTARLAGLPIDPITSITRAGSALRTLGLEDDDVEAITDRLRVTMHSLDARSQRPNLVLGLSGPAAGMTEAIALAFGATVFGSEERVLTIDLSVVRDQESLSILVGSPPGYVGWNRPLAIHQLAVTPSVVVVLTGAELCHPVALQLFADALATGSIADSNGTRYYLGDTIVLIPISAKVASHQHHRIGFGDGEDAHGASASTGVFRQALGESFASLLDLVVSDTTSKAEPSSLSWLIEEMQESLSRSYARRGIDIRWSEAAQEALLRSLEGEPNPAAAQRHVEELLADAVFDCISLPKPGERCAVAIGAQGDRLSASVEQRAEDEQAR